MLSIVAMVSAGVYGTADLVNDLEKGTFIRYEEESPVKEIKPIQPKAAATSMKINPVEKVEKKEMVKVEKKTSTEKMKIKTEDENSKTTEEPKLNYKLFSRSRPYVEEEVLAKPDSLSEEIKE